MQFRICTRIHIFIILTFNNAYKNKFKYHTNNYLLHFLNHLFNAHFYNFFCAHLYFNLSGKFETYMPYMYVYMYMYIYCLHQLQKYCTVLFLYSAPIKPGQMRSTHHSTTYVYVLVDSEHSLYVYLHLLRTCTNVCRLI